MTRLLSDNDLKYLNKAQEQGKVVTLERRLHGYAITATTKAVGYPWQVDMIIQLRETYGNMITLQNFATVDDLRRVKGWKENYIGGCKR